MAFLKLCAIGRFRRLAHGHLPPRHTDRMLPCASLAKRIARRVYSSCPILLSNPSAQTFRQSFLLFRRGQKEGSSSFIINMLGNCFFAMLECGGPNCGPLAVSECGGIAIVVRPCQNVAERGEVHRPCQNAARRAMVARLGYNEADRTAQILCRDRIAEGCSILSRSYSGQIGHASYRDRIVTACSVLSRLRFR